MRKTTAFQSTRPSRASTKLIPLNYIPLAISIHKALTGLDEGSQMIMYGKGGFQSTRPSRASTLLAGCPHRVCVFQSTRPSRASTSVIDAIKYALTFQSTRPSRASTLSPVALVFTSSFQSTRPSRASTAIFTNFFQLFFSFLSIMLHFSHSTPLPIQKAPIFYALFPAFSSANIPTFPCPLHIRTKKSTVLPHQIQALPLYAPPYFYIGFPDYKISGCLYLYQ